MNALAKYFLTLTLAVSSATVFAQAATTTESSGTTAPVQLTATGSATDTAADRSEGEIRKIDKEAGKLTIKHGPLKNLGMPAMSMIFRAKDPAMLNNVKAGDKISFVADKVDGAFTVMQLEVKQ